MARTMAKKMRKAQERKAELTDEVRTMEEQTWFQPMFQIVWSDRNLHTYSLIVNPEMTSPVLKGRRLLQFVLYKEGDKDSGKWISTVEMEDFIKELLPTIDPDIMRFNPDAFDYLNEDEIQMLEEVRIQMGY